MSDCVPSGLPIPDSNIINHQPTDKKIEEPRSPFKEEFILNEVLFYCKKDKCKGFWFLDKTEDNNIYRCPVCETYNCFKCQAIHNGMTCEEYNSKLENGESATTNEAIQEHVVNKSAAWKCEFCEYSDNLMETAICVYCSRTNDEIIKAKKSNTSEYYRLIELEENNSFIPNYDKFQCIICMEMIEPNNGVQLRGCLHHFCHECLRTYMATYDMSEIKCPFEGCTNFIEDREIKTILSPAVYNRHLDKSLRIGKTQIKNGYQCCVTNCPGWWIFTEGVYVYNCPECQTKNCISCKASHEGIDCQTYQDNLFYSNDKDGIKTINRLEQMLNVGEAQHCPTCNIIVVKNGGCPEMYCTMCRTAFVWSDNTRSNLKLK